jgi:rubrerythrin
MDQDTMANWTVDDIDWDRFDGARVDSDLLESVKAAALVEANGGLYEAYLHNVFADDPDFRDTVSDWAADEERHGEVLGRWAMLADPTFDYEASLARFRDGYAVPIDVEKSVRGTRSGELIARCVVEAGTSSLYSALAAAADEPVLQQICRKIAADEFRHYKLFYDTLGPYLDGEKVGRWRRLWVAASRVFETEDDELAFAYHCANHPNETYDRARSTRAFARRAYRAYRREHLERAVAMILKAVGIRPRGRVGRGMARFAWGFVRWRVARLSQA